MSLESVRNELVRYAQRLEHDGLALGTSGNLSVRVGELIAITPSAVPNDALTPDLIGVIELEGSAAGVKAKVSTELPMHLAAYRASDATAVVHTHSPYATTLSTVIDELPAVHYLTAALGGPVRVAAYHTPGTNELARAVADALRERSAVLLQNHGSLTIGSSLGEAYERNRLLEWLCALYYRARLLGEPRILTQKELDDFALKLRDYGQPAG